jgi:hypothetical protein
MIKCLYLYARDVRKRAVFEVGERCKSLGDRVKVFFRGAELGFRVQEKKCEGLGSGSEVRG